MVVAADYFDMKCSHEFPCHLVSATIATEPLFGESLSHCRQRVFDTLDNDPAMIQPTPAPAVTTRARAGTGLQALGIGDHARASTIVQAPEQKADVICPVPRPLASRTRGRATSRATICVGLTAI